MNIVTPSSNSNNNKMSLALNTRVYITIQYSLYYTILYMYGTFSGIEVEVIFRYERLQT